MSHIKTATGFEAEIDEHRLDDYRLSKAIRATKTDMTAFVDIVGFVLGEDEDRLIEHLIETDGQPTHEALKREIEDIFAQLSESKKK